jgi:hypothetical protein
LYWWYDHFLNIYLVCSLLFLCFLRLALLLFMQGLVSPIGKLRPLIQQIISWERPFVTGSALAVTLLTIYK